MKSFLAAIVISLIAIPTTSAMAESAERNDDRSKTVKREIVPNGLGLLMDTPQSPVDRFYDQSTQKA